MEEKALGEGEGIGGDAILGEHLKLLAKSVFGGVVVLAGFFDFFFGVTAEEVTEAKASFSKRHTLAV